MVEEKGVCQLDSTSRGTELCDAPESRTREANPSFNHKGKIGLLSAKHLQNMKNGLALKKLQSSETVEESDEIMHMKVL